MATGLYYSVEPSPGVQRGEEPRHIRAEGGIFLMGNTLPAGKMQGIFKRASKIFWQTRALLWKNILLIWRMKTENFQEWITSVVFLLVILISSSLIFHYPRQEIPYDFLGRLDDPAFNATGVTLTYTPVTNTTRRIMSKVASDSAMKGIIIEEMENEKKMEKRGVFEEDVIGVVFNDDVSYRLRFQSYSVVSPNDAFEHIDVTPAPDCAGFPRGVPLLPSVLGTVTMAVLGAWAPAKIGELSVALEMGLMPCVVAHGAKATNSQYYIILGEKLTASGKRLNTCFDFSSSSCKIPSYWYTGFLSVQSSIDAAVIEMKTNHSVWEEMKSISGVRLESPLIKPLYKLDYIWFIVYVVLCFSPYIYFLSVKVLREKKRLKVLMRAMGLEDISFWLSWSLLYTVYISITASLLTPITIIGVIHDHNFFEIYFFYFFYGIASIHFCFMLCSLLKQPNIASFVAFVLHIIFGLLGFWTLFENLPLSLEWIFNLFSPFAFTAGISKMIKLDKYGPAFTPELYPFFNLYFILSLDSVLYLLLAIYFDKVLPGKYGVPYPPSFFLRPSYWVKPRSGYVGVQAVTEGSHQPLSNNIEPMPPGFDGKEAIRLNNVTKIYKKRDKRTEALRGLSLNIYEGQITALLGHSGSGKTALLHMLSGFSKPSTGSAMIYSYNVSEVWHMEGFQAMVGICPQVNLHFEALTVKENLRTFAHVKGIQPKEVEQEVQKVLTMLDLTNLQDVRADALNWGQKRKLSLGIAILGNPQVLLLDEPTAGLDPCSRHHVWNLLKERQAGRVTLFATQSMEEADAHADRKAFLSNGRLQCVGSSLYLKRKWGIGYHLRARITDLCDPELISSLVRQYIPDAVLKGQKRGELCYMLPLENADSFPDLFSHLESSFLQGVVNYEVSRTTLEDVFLKLEGKEAIDQEENGDLEEKDKSLPVFPEQGSWAASRMALWKQQVCAVMRVRFFKLKHEGKFLRSILLFFGVFTLPMLMLLIGFQLWDSSVSWEITASSYFLPTEEKIQNKSTKLLIFNDTGSEIEDFISALKTQNIIPEITPAKNITSIPQYNGAIKISLEGKSYRFTVMCSAEPINCFPVLMNILSNTFLRLFNCTARIRIWSEPFYNTHSLEVRTEFFFICLSYMLILAAGLPPYFAVSSMEDYKLQARAQLQLAGLFPSAYWCGQALVDVPLFWTLMCLMFGVMVLFNRICPLQASTVLPLIICIIGYGVSLVLLIYLIAFKFRTGRSNRYIWSFVFILVNVTLYVLGDLHEACYFTFSTLVPTFPLLGCLMISTPRFFWYHSTDPESWNRIFVAAFAPYIHCVIFAFLLRCLEMRYGEAVPRLDPIFRIQQRRAATRQNRDPPGEEPPEVQAERERVRSVMASLPPEEESVIIVNSLRKEYEDKKASSIFKKKKKVAVKNLTFSVKKGEVLGLLGPSGAGKSTTINMISGHLMMTAGEVLRGARTTAGGPGLGSLGSLGCCPQHDPLWPALTVQQHLEAYSAIRGMGKEDAAITISRIAKAMDLQKHLKIPARRLSAGEARKLCFVLSVLGDPTVMLWDEPSVGMDPKGQQRMRKVMQTAVKSKERAAILSTQSLEEAAVMCDRVAILVAGQLRYIGSLEDLKSKFGTSYHLEVKMTDMGQSDALHAEILHLFPCAARQGRTSSLLIYKIPMEDALPLSQSFSKLEAAKQNFRLEEYSLSLHTLQQVFVDLTKDLEEHDLDVASDGAVEQRPLHP